MNLITSSLILILALTFIAWSKPKQDSFRFFSGLQKNIAFEQHKQTCFICKCKVVPYEGLGISAEYDHWLPYILGGKTIQSNCVLLCRDCNRAKSAYYHKDVKKIVQYVLKKRGLN